MTDLHFDGENGGIFESVRKALLGILALVTIALSALPSKALAQDFGPIPEVPGPKRSIAVGQIEATGGFDVAENWDVGNGLASMLTTELLNSGRFDVVERTNLSTILNEKQMQAANVTGGSGGVIPLKPVDYVIVGSVTEFGSPSKGGGMNIGGSVGGILGGLGTSKKTGRVSLDLRIVETDSGSVVDSFTVSSKASKTGFAIKGGYKGVALGGDQFTKTPLGEATREALHEAVVRIANTLGQRPWDALIVAYSPADELAIINLGQDSGIVIGDEMRVERLGNVLSDPETGEILKQARYYIGDLAITAIEEKVSYASFRSSDGIASPERGDLVIPVASTR